MTRPQVKLYFHYLNKRKLKDLERQAIVIWGYDPKKQRRGARQKELALKWQKDPLFGFPRDITYFGRSEIDQKVAISRRFGDRIAFEARWGRQRADACLGRHGTVARRCSMNDKLWGIYGKSRTKNVNLSLDDIRKMIMLDIKRSQLYPPGWTDDTVSPPQSYLDELRKKGVLDRILREIDEAAKGNGP